MRSAPCGSSCRGLDGSARPLDAAPRAPLYGMLTDRFGVTRGLDVTAPYNN